jgi:hypothetical protein
MFLGFYASIRSLVPIIWSIMNVVGDSAFAMKAAMALAVVLPTAFVIGSHWGNAGIAAAWMIGFPIVAIPATSRVFTKIELPWSGFFRVMAPATTGCLTMGIAVAAVKTILPEHYRMPVRLGVLVASGAIAYALVAGGLSYPRRHALRRAIGMLRNRKPNATGKPNATA